MTHIDLGLREVAWAGDTHLGVIRKSHLHPSIAPRESKNWGEANLGLSLEELPHLNVDYTEWHTWVGGRGESSRRIVVITRIR